VPDTKTIKKTATLLRLQNLLAIDEGHTWAAAGRIMMRLTGEGGANSVKANIEKLEAAYGRPLVREEDGRQVLTDLGHRLKNIALPMMNLWEGIARADGGTTVVAFLPQHAFFISRVVKRLRDQQSVQPHVLNERDRNIDTYEIRVIGPLAGGETDIVVGPPPPANAKRITELRRRELYTSRLEAMLPTSDTRTMITVTDLARAGNLLVPFPPTRSRKLLQDAIEDELGPADPGPSRRVFLEAYGTKVLVAFGEDGHGTVVVPSDIAYPFKAGHTPAGPEAEGFQWVPVVRSDGTALTQQVFATTRDDPSPDVERVIEVIREEVRRRNLDVTTSPLIPAQPRS